MLYGATTRGRTSGGGNMRTNYGSVYRSVGTAQTREVSPRGRSTHDFTEIILESRAEADLILDQMSFLLEEYGAVTVADLYASAGVSGVTFVDQQFGWESLAKAGVRHIREGFLIDLPPAKKLD